MRVDRNRERQGGGEARGEFGIERNVRQSRDDGVQVAVARGRERGRTAVDAHGIRRTEDAATEKQSEGACIMGWTDIGVGVDPPGAFAKIPKGLTQRVGDAVLSTTLRVLLSVFIGGLAQDYAKWATTRRTDPLERAQNKTRW